MWVDRSNIFGVELAEEGAVVMGNGNFEVLMLAGAAVDEELTLKPLLPRL